MTKQTRPASVDDERLEYLDDLRDSGATSMFGAGAYLQRDFGVDKPTASEILGYWMDTFGDESR